VADVAQRYGFRSPTTFTLQYRRRFGMPPSHALRLARNDPRLTTSTHISNA